MTAGAKYSEPGAGTQPDALAGYYPMMPSTMLFRLCAFVAFASSFSMRICDPMLPALASEFSVGLPAVAPAISFFAIAYGVMQLIYGPLGERFGLFRVAAWAAVGAGCASLVCAAAGRLEVLLLGRVLTGGLAAGIVPLLFAWIGERVPYAARQVSITRIISGVTLGVVAGQSLGGIMVDTVGWRWAFLLQGGLFLGPGTLMIRFLGREPGQIGDSTPAALPAQLPVVGSAAGSVTRRLMPKRMLSDYRELLALPWVRRITITVALEGLFYFGMLAMLPSALHQWFAIPLWHAGLVTALFGLGGFVYTRIAPRLLGALGEAKLVRLGWAGNAGAILALICSPNWWCAAIVCLLMGISFYCQHNTLQTHGTQMAPQRRGLAMACFASVYFAGQALGVVIASAVIANIGFTAHFALIAIALAVLGFSLENALAARGNTQDHALN